MMVKIQIEDICDGDYRPWDAALDSIRDNGGVILETAMGEEVIIKSEAVLKKFFNVQ